MTPSIIISFFQIIINSTFQEGKLKFPNKFVHEHGNELHNMVRLSIPTGSRWDVRVKREADGTIWLHDGFLEFMEENSVGIEFFLMFKYDGNSKFTVHIFDLTATEILYNRSSGLELCNVVNEPQMDKTGEGRDVSFNFESNKDSGDGEDDSFKDVSGDKESDDSTDNSLKSDSVYKVSDDNIGDSFRYESGNEDAEDGVGDKGSDDCADNSLDNKSVYQVSDDDSDDSFRSDGADEDADDDDYLIYEKGVKGSNNGRVDSRKYENGDKDSDDSSIECLGSTADHLLPQMFAEPSGLAAKDKQNVGVSRKNNSAGRLYLTRKKRQIIEGGLDANESMPKAGASGAGSNSSRGDIAKEKTTQVTKMQPMAPNSFRVTLKSYHITNYRLRFPCDFARSHICSSTTLIKLVDADNKEWEVLFIHHQDGRDCDYGLSNGWLDFVLAKGLKAGDICVFERIENDEEVKLKVSII